MNEEEKKAIESLRKNRGVSFAQADIISNLIEKQQKEIKELSEKLTEKICKGVEEEILEEYRQTIISKDKEIEELKKDNEHQWEQRCKMAIELDNNVVSKDKIKEIVNRYATKEIEYGIDFYREIKELLEEKQNENNNTNDNKVDN